MKKHAPLVATAIVASLALSGCVTEKAQFTVSKKQTLTGEVAQLIDNEFIDLMKLVDDETPNASTMSRRAYLEALIAEEDDLDATDLPRGVSYKIVSSKKRSGVKVIFSGATFKDANAAGKLLGQSPKKPLFKVRLDAKKHIAFTYTVNGTGTSAPETDTEFTGIDQAMTPTYTVKAAFPGKVLTTNGKLKGRTVTWKGEYATRATKLKATSKRR